ncbi:piggyBac transposable element-derived protein 4-like [Maniola hyperantus]|uniref:piggyBac transposable element-derived protein 4-like n=1 Tax=Aphantopus hyperantus TaxID=2795564 RepID=UPI00156913B6|nr:piggyBac transposable element-derived protein 4-like [Maniola hyperantus]
MPRPLFVARQVERTPEGNLLAADQVLMERSPSGSLQDEAPLDDGFDSGSEAEEEGPLTLEHLHELLVEEEEEPEEQPEHVVTDDGFAWSEDFSSFAGVREEFHEVPGARIEGTSPSGLFTQLWDEGLMNSVAEETNRYAWEYIAKAHEHEEGLPAHSRVHKWVETSVNELYRLISIIILMGMCVRGRVDEYWSTGVLGMPEFRKRMTLNRFILLMKFLHFADNNKVTSHGSQRKLAKIKPVIDHLNQKFKAAYTPRQELSLDESLLLWKGHLSWVQCIRTKVARFGIKSYELCEAASGYVLNMIFYTGADTSSTQPIFGFTSATAKVVLNLFKDYFGKGYTLFMDNFYNSVRLSRFLKTKKTDVVGTLNRRKVDTPDDIRRLNDKRVNRGAIVSRHCGDVSVVSWKDVKLVTTVSTYHKDDVVQGRRAGENFAKPAVVADYNKFMGGVDLKDQKLSMYLLERKRGMKWYIKVFKRLLNITILNAYVIYTANIGQQQKKMTHRQFRYQLAEELAQKFGTSCAQPRERSGNPCARLDRNLEHFPEHSEVNRNRSSSRQPKFKRMRCVRCAAKRKDSKVNTLCRACKVFLCVGQCWLDFHTQEN